MTPCRLCATPWDRPSARTTKVCPSCRFWTKVDRTPGGCWRWTGAVLPGGYGHLRVGGADVYAHRFSYELIVAPIPEGMVIDHLCRNRACVNPAHLEPVTTRENLLRGVGFAAVNAAKTQCVRGHKFDERNTVWARGKRTCRACIALRRVA